MDAMKKDKNHFWKKDGNSWLYGDNPCHDCTEETGRCAEPNCHMTCERFLAWAKRKDERKAVLLESTPTIINYRKCETLRTRRERVNGKNIRKK